MPQLQQNMSHARTSSPVTHRKILAVGFSSAEFSRLAPLLERSSFELDRFPDPSGAFDLLGPISFHMILVRYPLPEMPMEDFLGRIRHPSTRSRTSSLVILTDADKLQDAERFLMKGANRVLGLEPRAAQIESVIAELLHIAPRRSARFFARLQARLDGVPNSVLGVVRNTSATGLLVETDQPLRRGSEVSFELTLPGGQKPVRGRAQVVRHTQMDKEHLKGVGMRILSFNGKCGEDYNAFLNRQVH